MGTKTLGKIIVCNENTLLHLQIQVKTLNCEPQAIYKHLPTSLS